MSRAFSPEFPAPGVLGSPLTFHVWEDGPVILEEDSQDHYVPQVLLS
jgi:hypothetical protein